ncbi:Methyltransferase-like protein 23 [Durusdinium trenchii]|uniref:Methyltransferase-like protein 23 n=1 Tax=Durusdinium trenchii TaxID=1381693 RepID=A0ABP0HYC3_9DINO
MDRPQGQLPLVLQEAPETVGGKVWRGAWLLWKSLLHFEGALPSGRRVLEVGAGVGLVGLLLAADHGMKVTLSETRDGYSGAATTFENLRRNVERFHERRLARAAQADGADGVGAVEFGEAQVMELDWTQGVPVPEHSFDLVIGSDVLYEPHLFEDLLDVLQTAAPKAVLVQNLARKGTAYFLELCRQRNIEVKSEDVSHLDDDLPQTDAQDGVYHCWFLDFSQALPPDPGKSRWPEVAA